MKLLKPIFFFLFSILIAGCNAKEAIDDIIDTVDVERKPIQKSITGLNAFANDSRFGTSSSQFAEVKNTLGLRYVRILMNWDNGAQSSPNSALNFSFYDSLIAAVPSGVEVLIVTTEVPSWMSNSANWIDNNPRTTFVQKWLRPLAQRYSANSKVKAIQVWNEPNMASNADNQVMGFVDSPENYAQMLTLASSTIKQVAPSIKVVNAATTAINQNFPSSLDYNKVMVSAGVLDAVDIFAIHYYGEQFERVVQGGGVRDFLNSEISKPIWVTESGEQGFDQQLRYVERAWPFLKEKIPGIERFYYYQFTEATNPQSTYGLRNLSTDNSVSDLYVWLRDN
jgi:hypothetical protein